MSVCPCGPFLSVNILLWNSSKHVKSIPADLGIVYGAIWYIDQFLGMYSMMIWIYISEHLALVGTVLVQPNRGAYLEASEPQRLLIDSGRGKLPVNWSVMTDRKERLCLLGSVMMQSVWIWHTRYKAIITGSSYHDWKEWENHWQGISTALITHLSNDRWTGSEGKKRVFWDFIYWTF